MFFSGMQAALRYVPHETWRDFPVFITAEEDLEIKNPRRRALHLTHNIHPFML
jgi:hypothetical protein